MVLRQIRDHMRPKATSRWDGCNFLFEGATFDCGDLSGAEFGEGCHVSFYDAEFVERTFDLTRITLLKGSRMYFGKARGAGGKIKLRDAIIRDGASLSFQDADLSEEDVERIDLTIEKAAEVHWGPLSTPS